jgi:hypothetical protein
LPHYEWRPVGKLDAFLQTKAVQLDAKMHMTIFNDFVDTSDFSAAEGEVLQSFDDPDRVADLEVHVALELSYPR